MKFRLTVTAVYEYVPDPKAYGTDDPAAMLAIDQAAADDDPFLSLEESADWTAKVERIE